MGQGGANNKMEGVKSRNNKPKPNVHFIPDLGTKKTCVLHLQPVLAILCMKSKIHNMKLIEF